MRPLRLTLKNFAGIASGQGKEQVTVDLRSISQAAQIVAIAGPNGAGKTTIMDNLHPYRVMPSRASMPTPGGFSFYEHITAGEGSKEFLWEHQGQHYLSLLRFRATAKTKKTEAYLYLVDGNGENQVPWSNPRTGDQSDGKADTYDKAVETILGKPEVFFQAQFSAQGKEPIGSMSASDVKRLIAEMIGANRSSELSARANEVVRSLRPQLAAYQDELNRLEAQCSKGAALEADLAQASHQREGVEKGIESLSARATELTISIAAASSNLEQRRASLLQHQAFERQVQEEGEQYRQELSRLNQTLSQEKVAAEQRVQVATQGLRSAESAMKGLLQERMRLTDLAETAPNIETAKNAVASINLEMEQIKNQLLDLEPKVLRMEAVQRSITQLTGTLASATKDGEHLVAAIETARSTAALLDEVPCKGTNMAGQCRLLGHANTASTQVPVMQERLDAARKSYKQNAKERSELSNTMNELVEASKTARDLKERHSFLQVEWQRQISIVVTEGQVKQAAEALVDLRKKIDQCNNDLAQAVNSVEHAQRTLGSIDESRRSQTAQVEQDHAQRMARLEEVRKTLPKLVETHNCEQLERQLQQCTQELSTAKESNLLLGNRITQIRAQQLKVEEAQAESKAKREICEAVSKEISQWMLLAKALGTDGIIAMSIDDAGPAIADIANALLDECYGGRFALSLVTQTETQKGIAKETFRIQVEDNERCETKFLETMSGGEKVWINECLVRAIALYMAQVADTRCQTLFSDESDGALDPQRKRQYMAMKRAVLERGGYDREYLITQTPELLQMCDAVIDVATL